MKCFYHYDLDGRCAGALVAHYTGNYNSNDYFEVDYDTPIPVDIIKDGETVYFVDYSFTEKTKSILLELNSRCNLIWIDHHISSINLIKEDNTQSIAGIKGIRAIGESGALLTNRYFSDTIYEFSELVSDYDCWIYKYGNVTTHFKLGIESYEHNALDTVWIDLFDNNDLLQSIIEKGAVIKDYIDKDNKLYLDNYSYESTLNGIKCLVVNKKSNSWIFGDKINDYPIVVIWVFNGKNYRYSLFSNKEDIDCSQIAELFGGGGHKSAAGFSLDRLILTK